MPQQDKPVLFVSLLLLIMPVVMILVGVNPRFSFSEEIRYQSGDRRDPFVPVNRSVTPGSTEIGIKVEGIVYDPKGKSIVVIHGEPFKVGDSVADQKIIAIYSSRIVASFKGVESEYWISNAERELAEAKKNKGTKNG